MTATSDSTSPWPRAEPSPATTFASVLTAAVGTAATRLEHEVRGWAERGGATRRAGAEGVTASLHGRNPFWAAVKGAWKGGTSVVRAAIVAAVVAAVLLLVLSPALLLVFLLSLLVIAAVHRLRAATA